MKQLPFLLTMHATRSRSKLFAKSLRSQWFNVLSTALVRSLTLAGRPARLRLPRTIARRDLATEAAEKVSASAVSGRTVMNVH